MSKFKVVPTEKLHFIEEDDFNTLQTQNPKDDQEEPLNQDEMMKDFYNQYNYDFKHIEDILMEGMVMLIRFSTQFQPGYIPIQNRIRVGKNDKGETMTITIVKNALAEELLIRLEHAQFMKEVVSEGELTLDHLQKNITSIIGVSAKRGEKSEINALNKQITRSRTSIVKNLEKNIVRRQSDRTSNINFAKRALSAQKEMRENDNIEDKTAYMAQYLTKRAGDTLRNKTVFMMMDFNDLARQRWDIFLIIISVWNAFYIPFLLTFKPAENIFLEVLMSVMHLSLLLDVLVTFRTSYLTFEGQNVQNWDKIAYKYIFRGWFIFDLASGFPYNIISFIVEYDLSWFELLAMTKILRANRIESIIASYSQETRSTIKVGKLLVQLLIYVHWISCGWFLATKYDGIWIPPPDEMEQETTFYTSHEIWEQYFQCLYTSVTILTGTDIHPKSSSEYILAVCLFLGAYLFNGQIFGEMAILIEAINHKEKLRLHYIEDTSKVIDTIKLSSDLSQEIRNYIIATQTKRDMQIEMNKFIEMIGSRLKLKVSWQIFNNIFSINYVLTEMVKKQPASMMIQQGDGQGSDIVSLFVRRLLLQFNNPEEVLFTQGQQSTDLFFIAKGTVSISFTDTAKNSFDNFRILKQGDHFGEIGIVYNCSRTATALTLDYCTFARLPIHNYERLIGEIPEFQTELKRYVQTRYKDDPVKQWIFQVMKQLPFLQDIEQELEWPLFHNIYYSMKRRIILKGDLLCKPGSDTNKLTIIQDGVVDVFTFFDNSEGEFPLENLMRGSILFYRTFFIDEPAQVFMRAVQQTTVLEIGIEDLKKFMRDFPMFERRLISHQMKYLNNGKQYPLDYMRRLHTDYVSENQRMTLPEVYDRANMMRLIVMRRVHEIRQQKAKPKLTQLLQVLRNGSIKTKILTRKRILDLYEYDTKEREKLDSQIWEETKAKYSQPGEDKETNKVFTQLRIKLRQALDQLTQEEEMIDDMREGMWEILKREGIQMNDTFNDEDAPIVVDITEEYERLHDILFVSFLPLTQLERYQRHGTHRSNLIYILRPYKNESGKKRGPNGETETVMIVKNYLLEEFDKKAKYVQREHKEFNRDTKAEILDMQQQLALAISMKARKGERNDVRQLYYNINSVRSKIKKIALDHDVVPELQQAIQAVNDAPVETQEQEEKAWLIKKQKEENPLKVEVKNLKQEFISRYLISKTGDDKISHDFIISFNNKNRLIWDSLILLMAIWNCLETPLDIAFEPKSQLSIIIINYVIDLFFYIDIIVAFRTSYLTFDGQEVKDWKKIGWNYIFHGTFFLDLLSVLPFYELIPGDQRALQILGVLKLIRIKRLPKLIANIDMKADTKAYLEVFQVIFFLVLFLHLITCSWFFVTKLDGSSWVPPSDLTMSQSTSIYTTTDLSNQYVTTLHTAVMFFTGNDQLPVTPLQLFIATLFILLAYLVNGSIFGYMAVLLRLMFKKGNEEQEHKDGTDRLMEKIVVNKQFRDEIARYDRQTRIKNIQKKELIEFMDMIGPSLKIEVTKKLVSDIFDKNYVLCAMSINLEKTMKKQDGSDFASLVMRRLSIKLFNPDDVIVKQGDMTNEIYFIAEGEVSISIQDRVKQSFENFRILEAGDHFGEISAIYGCPRSATAQANDFCTMALLTKQNYDRIAGEVPEFATEMTKFVQNAYIDDEVKIWAFETLKQLPFLKGLEPDKESALLHKIYFSMKRKVLYAGELYMNPGKPIKHLTIIQDGILELYTNFGGKEFSLEQLMRGSILNYRSFFTDDQAQIYARAATTELTVLELTYETLLSLTQDSQNFDKKFISHQMLVLNTSFKKHFYPLDYIRVWHTDYMSAKQASVPADVSERASLMKLIVMRRVAEVRQERGKPKLSELLVESKEIGLPRLATRKKMLDLYGHFEEDDIIEQEQKQKEKEQKQQAAMPQKEDAVLEGEEGPQQENASQSRDKIYEMMKSKLLKSIQDLDSQASVIEMIRQRLDEEIQKEYPQQVIVQ